MKRVFILFALLALPLIATAQLPAEWVKYSVGDEYMYEYIEGRNDKGISEDEYRQQLRSDALVGLSRQIEATVQSISVMEKSAIDGHSRIDYGSSSTISTDIEISLTATEIIYNHSTKKGSAIAYINKVSAQRHYQNEVEMSLGRVERQITMAEEYSADGYDRRAVEEYRIAEEILSKSSSALGYLSIFGAPKQTVETLSARTNSLFLAIEKGIKESKHGLKIYLNCEAELFDKPFNSLAGKVKGGIATDGCSFVSESDDADWAIEIIASAREYDSRIMGSTTIFTAYVDAYIIITNNVTDKVVCNDEITAKGTHTVNYTEAARTAYTEAQNTLLETINQYINN